MTYRRVCENEPIRDLALQSADQRWTPSPTWLGIAQDTKDPNRTKRQKQDKLAFSLCLAKHILLPSDMDTSGPQAFWVGLETIGSPHSLVSRWQILWHGPPKVTGANPSAHSYMSCGFSFSGGPYHKKWGVDRKSVELLEHHWQLQV